MNFQAKGKTLFACMRVDGVISNAKAIVIICFASHKVVTKHCGHQTVRICVFHAIVTGDFTKA